MEKLYTDNRIGYFIEAAVLLLMAIGTVFVVSAGADIEAEFNIKNFYNFTTLRNILFFPLALVVMYFVSAIDYKRLNFVRAGIGRSFTPYFLALSVILLVLVLFVGRGIEDKNVSSLRWFRFSIAGANISFQPSELAKWSLLFFLAAYMDLHHLTMKKFKRFGVLCAAAGLIVLLIITQDFGTAAFISMLVFIMFIIGGVRWWYVLGPVLLLIPTGFLMYATAPNFLLTTTRLNRINAYLARFFPESFPDITAAASNYQADQSLMAISGGGIRGRGLGLGISKYEHLPEDTSDFIFAVICEEVGFIGAAVVLGLFIALVVLGIIAVMRCNDRFGKLLGAGIVIAITLQAAINIGVVTVVLPTKGIPLPFLSAGGTSMLLTAAAVGVLLNIARRPGIEREIASHDDLKSFLRKDKGTKTQILEGAGV